MVLPLVMGGFLYGINTASAQEDFVEVDFAENSVIIDFNNTGDYYKIYKNNEFLYQGNDKKFVDKSIKDGQNYNLGIYKDNKIDQVVYIRSNGENKNSDSIIDGKSSEDKEDLLKKQIDSGYIDAIITSEKVVLTWSALVDSDGIYDIYRDEEKIGETKDTEFIDMQFTKGELHRYGIIAKVEIDES